MPRTKAPARLKLVVVILLAARLLPGWASGEDTARWPQFRGPNGSGVALSEKPAPSQFSRETNLLWQLELPACHSSPCIFGDRIFLTAFESPTKTLATFCLDRSKGTLLWKRTIEAKKLETVHKISNPATATAVTDGKAVYVYFGSFGLVAYDFAGKELWTKPLPRPILRAGGGSYGNGTSPILSGDLLLLEMHLEGASHLLAVRRSDGQTAWTAPEPSFNYGYATAVTWTEGQDQVVGTLNGGKFTAFNLKDGSERWWVTGLPRQTIATPSLGQGLLFLHGTGMLGAAENMLIPPAFEDMLAKYDTNQDKLISVEELPGSLLFADRQTTTGSGNMSVQIFLRFFTGKAKTAKLDRAGWDQSVREMKGFVEGSMGKTGLWAIRLGGTGDVSQKNVVWTQGKAIPEVPSALLYQNRLYLVKSGGQVTCREPGTGKLVFEGRLGATGGYFASPVAAAGKIYAASDCGIVTVFEAADTLKVLARNDLGEPIMATPAIVDGQLYIRTATHLFAFGR